MAYFIQVLAVIAAGIVVGIADAFIKKVALEGAQGTGFWEVIMTAMKNPWMYVAFFFYLLQILFFVYIFRNNWKLGIVSNMQNVFFSITAITIGYLMFQEKLSAIQFAGVLVSMIGVFMMNFA